jgi:hypothetical protein
MCDKTYKRVLLQRLSIANPRTPTEEWGTYITKLAKGAEMKAVEADLFLRGAFYREKVRDTTSA